MLDLDRMKRLVEGWLTGGCHDNGVTQRYRLALLRHLCPPFHSQSFGQGLMATAPASGRQARMADKDIAVEYKAG
jgi:hypothetical protein